MRFPAVGLLIAAVAACSGTRGDIGPQGPQGPQGPKGDTGAAGAQGPQGPSLWVVDVASNAKIGPLIGYNGTTASSPATVTFFFSRHVWTWAVSGTMVPPPACAFYYTTSNCTGTPYVSLSGGTAGSCNAGRFDIFLHKNGGGNGWALTNATPTPNSNVASNDATGTCTANSEQITAAAVMQPTQPPLGVLDIQQI